MKSLKLCIGLISLLGAMAAVADRVPPGSVDEIRERLQPFGQLCRAGETCAPSAGGPEATAGAAGSVAASTTAGRSGEQVYDQFCGICHAAGVAGAPLLGNADAWAARIATGPDALWNHTLNGFNTMPPKGTCMDCSDEELRAAIDYMVSRAQ